MPYKLLVTVLFISLISSAASADRSINSKGPYLVTEVVSNNKVTIYKMDSSGKVETLNYNSQMGKIVVQRIEKEIAKDSLEKGSFKTLNNEAIIDFVSMEDGFTYGTMFGPPGEELFVIETSKFQDKRTGNYKTFKENCNFVHFISLGR